MDRALSGPLNIKLARSGVFMIVLIMAIISLVFDSTFHSERIVFTLFAVSLAGLSVQFLQIFFKIENKNFAFFVSIWSSLALCGLFVGLQSAQSLFLLLLLVNILLYGMEAGVQPATELSLITSCFYSLVIVLSPSFSHFQDILSLGLFNVAAFVVAALSGQLSEKLVKTEKAYAKSQNLLEDLSTRHRVLVEELPLGLLVWDGAGDVIEKNHFFMNRFADVCDWKEFFQVHIKAALLDQRSQFFHQFEENYSGRDFVFRNALIQSGSKAYVLTLMEDVTEQRQLENDLKQKEKMAAIGTLAAGIAHEIRNPLAGMSGSIELLSVKPNTEEDQKLFKIILREIDRLNRLITEFLEYSKPEKKYEDSVNLTTVIDGVLSFIETSADRNPNLRIEKVYGSIPMIKGSADKLRQAFLNIIINSVQAMNKVESPHLKIQITQDSSKSNVEVFIVDNGCGMSEETKRKMFEPFHTTKPKGTGLGLAITHKILDSHQAQISVKSEVGQGTEFRLVFPCS